MGAELFYPEGRTPKPSDDANRSILKWASGAFAVLAVPQSGDNFIFTATSLLIKNVDQNRWFKLFVTGSAGLEQLDFSTEVVGPVAAAPIVTGDNFQFADSTILRWKHDTSGNFHQFNWYDDGAGAEIGAAATSDPGSMQPSGINYLFTATQLRFKDLQSGRYFAPALYGPVASQQLGYL